MTPRAAALLEVGRRAAAYRLAAAAEPADWEETMRAYRALLSAGRTAARFGRAEWPRFRKDYLRKHGADGREQAPAMDSTPAQLLPASCQIVPIALDRSSEMADSIPVAAIGADAAAGGIGT